MVTHYTYTFTYHLHIYTWSHTLYTLHFTHILVPWHIVQTTKEGHKHITSHRRHLGNTMATLGLRRPGEQVSTLTSGTCPPPGFPPNALRVTYTLNFLRGTFPWYSSTALYGSSVTLAQLHIYTFYFSSHSLSHSHAYLCFFFLTWHYIFQEFNTQSISPIKLGLGNI